MAEQEPPLAGDPAGDAANMRTALVLAARNLGRVWPNPAVGCILVGSAGIVGRGWTQPGGRPHAETEALARAGGAARGATAYVTLEPCAHRGATPPCAEALVAAGIARAVIAVEDPDPRVSGRSIARLRAAGIALTTGVCEQAAIALNAGFLLRIREGRPLFTWKAATSLDGRIATRSGDSRWITGAAARAAGHRLRAAHDALLIGSGTALADDPELTCRLAGMQGWSPVRIVADRRLRLGPTSRLVASARTVPTWVITDAEADPHRRRELNAAGIETIEVATDASGCLDPRAIARALAARGLTRVLIEGGGTLAASFLAADLVDRVEWFRAPRLIGGDGVPAAAPLGIDRLAEAPAWRRVRTQELAEDIVERYVRQE